MAIGPSRAYLLFWVVAAFCFTCVAIAFLINRLDLVLGLAALGLASFVFGETIKREEIKNIWTQSFAQRFDSIQDGINDIIKKIDEILELLKKEK